MEVRILKWRSNVKFATRSTRLHGPCTSMRADWHLTHACSKITYCLPVHIGLKRVLIFDLFDVS